MLSIPYDYRKLISGNRHEVSAITFLAALYDFQMKVGVIRDRFRYLIEILNQEKMRLTEILDLAVFEDLMDKFHRRYRSFHRFDRHGIMLWFLLKIFDTIDWEKVLSDDIFPLDEYLLVTINKMVNKELTEIANNVSSDVYKRIKETIRIFVPKRTNGPNKRINLFLRWMVRDEYPDLGLWNKYYSKSKLIIPLGTEIRRTAGRIFCLGELGNTRKNALMLTRKLKEINPDDPIKYDFVISRPAILGLCNKDLGSSFCNLCPLRNVCRTYRERRKHGQELISHDLREQKKKRHDKIIKRIQDILNKYEREYGSKCNIDYPIGRGVRPDILCNFSSDTIVVGEVKTSMYLKDAVIKLKMYIDELKRANSDKKYKYHGIIVYGNCDNTNFINIIELIRITSLEKKVSSLDIIIAGKDKNRILEYNKLIEFLYKLGDATKNLCSVLVDDP